MKDLDDKPCNGCTVCCEVYEIAELGKLPNTVCKHGTRNGCAAYGDRPLVCQGFFCVWQKLSYWPDFMWPKRSGFVLTLSFIENRAAIAVHLTKRGVQNWRRPKYYELILKYYRYVREVADSKQLLAIMRVYRPSGAQTLYNEILDEFVPIGKPGSDRESFLIGYPFGAPALFGTKVRMTELREKINADLEKLRQLPQEQQQQVTKEFPPQWQKIFADSMG